jgi:hypothetical protein
MSKISVDKLTKAYMKIKEKRSEIAKDFKDARRAVSRAPRKD